MALEAKYRFKEEVSGKIIVDMKDTGEPNTFYFRPQAWLSRVDGPVKFTIAGKSHDNNLVPKNIPIEVLNSGISGQYICYDKEGNVFEAYVYGEKDGRHVTLFLGALKSIPSSK